MHEYAITESLLEIIQGEAERAGAVSVDEITVVIGELSTFVDSSIEFYFEELSRGTISEGASLKFQKLEARAVCNSCSAAFRPLSAFCACPGCGSPVFQLAQGREMFSASIARAPDAPPYPQGE